MCAVCWECVVGWARDKVSLETGLGATVVQVLTRLALFASQAECPLCRQRIQLNRLLPVYNL